MNGRFSLTATYTGWFAVVVACGVLWYVRTLVPFCDSDARAYHTATSLFFVQQNPYSSELLQKLQSELCRDLRAPLMAWNPPIFFITLGLVFWPVEPFLASTSAATSLLCSLAVLWLIARAAEVKLAPKTVLVFLTLAFPLLFELQLGQWSSFLVFCYFCARELLRKNHDAYAGVAAALFLLKPHIMLLPAIHLAVFSVLHRRWSFFWGIGGAVVGLCGVTEFLFPGVHLLWIRRDDWPVHLIGSTLPLLLRPPIYSALGFDPKWPLLLVAAVVILITLFRVSYSERILSEMKVPILLIIITCFWSPYGYVFDQVSLLGLVATLAVLFCADEKPRGIRYWIALGAWVSVFVVLWAGQHITLYGLPLWWVVMPSGALITWFLLYFRQPESTPHQSTTPTMGGSER